MAVRWVLGHILWPGQAGLRDTSHYIMPQSDKRARTSPATAIQILNMLIQILKLAKPAKVPISRMPARILVYTARWTSGISEEVYNMEIKSITTNSIRTDSPWQLLRMER